MLRLKDKIIVIADSLEQNLPVGEYGYVIAYDRNQDNAFDYVIRIPKVNRNFFVPACDVELEERILEQEAEWTTREALIDYALLTYNEKLFYQIMNGDSNEVIEDEEATQDTLSQAEFIKQVNLRAWI